MFFMGSFIFTEADVTFVFFSTLCKYNDNQNTYFYIEIEYISFAGIYLATLQIVSQWLILNVFMLQKHICMNKVMNTVVIIRIFK